MATKLKAYRTGRGISQFELAMKCSDHSDKGPSRWTIQLLEKGYRSPNQNEIQIISKALGVSPKEIFPKYKAKRTKSAGKSA